MPSDSNLKQSGIDKFAVIKPPPVTKAGIAQHFLEVMVDLNLVGLFVCVSINEH